MFACLTTLVLAFLTIKAVSDFLQEKKLFSLVNQVTRMVEWQYETFLLSGGGHSFLVVEYIFEDLFEPSQRADNLILWKKVAKYIQDHESCIRLETRWIYGAEMEVWQWVPVCGRSLKTQYF
jgi:hypothetical protein